MLKVYINFKVFSGVSGGANSFLRNLISELEKRGINFVKDINEADIIFLNATQHNSVESSSIYLNKDIVTNFHKYGKPIIHRKSTNLASGLSKMVKNEITYGDFLQLEFSHLISYNIFQSRFSLKIFRKSGFSGNNYSLIRNGVDTNIFNFIFKKNKLVNFSENILKYIYDKSANRSIIWRILSKISKIVFQKINFKNKIRKKWVKGTPLKGVITTWSSNPKKIDPQDIKDLDKFLNNCGSKIKISYIGPVFEDINLKSIKKINRMNHNQLSEFYKNQHFYIMFNQNETFSNAAIEALACGLPILYKLSGSNKELVGNFGYAMTGSWKDDFKNFVENYENYYTSITKNHSKFNISTVADKYLEIFYKVYNNS